MQDHLGFTALGAACSYGHVNVVQLLINRGAAIDYQNKVRLLLQCSVHVHRQCGTDSMVCSV